MPTPRKPRVNTPAAQATKVSLVDNLIAVAVVGASAGVLEAVNGDGWSWRVLATAAGTGALAGVAAYLRTAYVTPYVAIRRETRE